MFLRGQIKDSEPFMQIVRFSLEGQGLIRICIESGLMISMELSGRLGAGSLVFTQKPTVLLIVLLIPSRGSCPGEASWTSVYQLSGCDCRIWMSLVYHSSVIVEI